LQRVVKCAPSRDVRAHKGADRRPSVAQPIVADNEIRPARQGRKAILHFRVGARRDDLMSPTRQQAPHRALNDRVVVDDKDQPARSREYWSALRAQRGEELSFRERNANLEHQPGAR
jgi:hypothetical protein